MDRRTFLGALAPRRAARRRGATAGGEGGILAGSTPTSPESRHIWAAFFQELRNRGHVEGQNVVFQGRYYGDRLDRLPAFADELVRLQVDVIVAAAAPAPETVKRATSTIPIVMANHSDPVASGLVASFARPGGNVTGLSMVALAMRSSSFNCSRRPFADSAAWHFSAFQSSRSTWESWRPRRGR